MPIASEIYYCLFEGAEEGEKPPVVLIHGAGGHCLSWPSEIRRLAGFRIYALDLPGHGKSGGCGQQSIQAYAMKVMEWLDAVGLHQAIFIGHSMGGAIGLTLALENPEQVNGIGLLGTGPRLRVSPALLESSSSGTTFHQAVESVVGLSFHPGTDRSLLDQVSRRLSETRQSVFYSDFLACEGFEVTERVSQIRRPCLVICGAQDRMVPLRHSQYLAANIPGASLDIIPDAGHMVMLEQPGRVAKSLAKFLPSVAY